MAEVTLREYLQHIERLLEDTRLDEAIAHSQRVLEAYPRNAEAYHYLGSGLMRQSRYAEAEDVFRRLLAAVPDDFNAHFSLSNIYDRQQKPDEALWHLERAFDQQPNNAAVIERLRELYQKYQGIKLDKVQLTAGAVANQHLASGNYAQAVDVLQRSLKRSPERTDLQLQLARAQWSNNQQIDAAETALNVLKVYPYSIEANRILTELWLQEGRPSDARRYLSRVEDVAPYEAVQLVSGQRASSDSFKLEELDYGKYAARTLASQEPDWLDSLGSEFDFAQEGSLDDVGDEEFDFDFGDDPVEVAADDDIDDLFGEFDLDDSDSFADELYVDTDSLEDQLSALDVDEAAQADLPPRTPTGLTGLLNADVLRDEPEEEEDDSWFTDVEDDLFADLEDTPTSEREATGLTGMFDDDLDNVSLDDLFDESDGIVEPTGKRQSTGLTDFFTEEELSQTDDLIADLEIAPETTTDEPNLNDLFGFEDEAPDDPTAWMANDLAEDEDDDEPFASFADMVGAERDDATTVESEVADPLAWMNADDLDLDSVPEQEVPLISTDQLSGSMAYLDANETIFEDEAESGNTIDFFAETSNEADSLDLFDFADDASEPDSALDTLDWMDGSEDDVMTTPASNSVDDEEWLSGDAMLDELLDFETLTDDDLPEDDFALSERSVSFGTGLLKTPETELAAEDELDSLAWLAEDTADDVVPGDSATDDPLAWMMGDGLLDEPDDVLNFEADDNFGLDSSELDPAALEAAPDFADTYDEDTVNFENVEPAYKEPEEPAKTSMLNYLGRLPEGGGTPDDDDIASAWGDGFDDFGSEVEQEPDWLTDLSDSKTDDLFGGLTPADNMDDPFAVADDLAEDDLFGELEPTTSNDDPFGTADEFTLEDDDLSDWDAEPEKANDSWLDEVAIGAAGAAAGAAAMGAFNAAQENDNADDWSAADQVDDADWMAEFEPADDPFADASDTGWSATGMLGELPEDTPTIDEAAFDWEAEDELTTEEDSLFAADSEVAWSATGMLGELPEDTPAQEDAFEWDVGGEADWMSELEPADDPFAAASDTGWSATGMLGGLPEDTPAQEDAFNWNPSDDLSDEPDDLFAEAETDSGWSATGLLDKLGDTPATDADPAWDAGDDLFAEDTIANDEPDWLSGLDADTPVAEAADADWLTDFDASSEDDPFGEPVADATDADWLTDFDAPDLGANTEDDPFSEPVAEAADADWLTDFDAPDLGANTEDDPFGEPVAEAADADWLTDFDASLEDEPAAEATDADWLTDFDDDDPFGEAASESDEPAKADEGWLDELAIGVAGAAAGAAAMGAFNAAQEDEAADADAWDLSEEGDEWLSEDAGADSAWGDFDNITDDVIETEQPTAEADWLNAMDPTLEPTASGDDFDWTDAGVDDPLADNTGTSDMNNEFDWMDEPESDFEDTGALSEDELDWVMEDDSEPDWMADFGDDEFEEASAPSPTAGMTGLLNSIQAQRDPSEAPPPEPAAASDDWLSDLGDDFADSAEDDGGEDDFDWGDLGDASAEPVAGTDDFDFGTSDDFSFEPASDENAASLDDLDWGNLDDSADDPFAEPAATSDEPDWLSGLGDDLDEEPVAAEASDDWLGELEPESTAADSALDDFDFGADDAEDDFDWGDLGAASAEPVAATDDFSFEPASDESGSALDDLDWGNLDDNSVESGDSQPATAADWLSDLDDDFDEQPVAAEASDDWLSELQPQSAADESTFDDLDFGDDEGDENFDWGDLNAADDQPEPVADEFVAASAEPSVVDNIDWGTLDNSDEADVTAASLESGPYFDADALSAEDELDWTGATEDEDDSLLDEALLGAGAAAVGAAAASTLMNKDDDQPVEDDLDWLTEDDPFADAVSETPVDGAEEEVDFAPAASAPDWLNAMVPGMDIDFEAEEDAPLDAGFVEGDTHRRRTLTEAEKQATSGGDFSWLQDIVEEETGMIETVPEVAPEPPPPPRRRFVFSRLPVWLRPQNQAVAEDTQAALVANTADDGDLPDYLDFEDLGTLDDEFDPDATAVNTKSTVSEISDDDFDAFDAFDDEFGDFDDSFDDFDDFDFDDELNDFESDSDNDKKK